MKENRQWTVGPPQINDGGVAIELHRHPLHEVVLIMGEGELLSKRHGIVRTSVDEEVAFNDGKVLPKQVSDKLWAFVFDYHTVRNTGLETFLEDA